MVVCGTGVWPLPVAFARLSAPRCLASTGHHTGASWSNAEQRAELALACARRVVPPRMHPAHAPRAAPAPRLNLHGAEGALEGRTSGPLAAQKRVQRAQGAAAGGTAEADIKGYSTDVRGRRAVAHLAGDGQATF